MQSHSEWQDDSYGGRGLNSTFRTLAEQKQTHKRASTHAHKYVNQQNACREWGFTRWTHDADCADHQCLFIGGCHGHADHNQVCRGIRGCQAKVRPENKTKSHCKIVATNFSLYMCGLSSIKNSLAPAWLDMRFPASRRLFGVRASKPPGQYVLCSLSAHCITLSVSIKS